MKHAVAAALCTALVTSIAARARADKPTSEGCESAYEESQRRQKKGALLEAREQAATCANAACPAEIVKFCSDIAKDLDATIPTIVVAVTDAAGKSVGGARLVVDGKEPGTPLDGRPVPLDPGLHRLHVVPPSADASPADLEVTILAGERNKRLEARLAPVRRDVGPTPPAGVAPAPSPGGGSKLPAGIAFGVGGVGLALGAVTGVLALSDESSLKGKCDTPTTCPVSAQGQIDRQKTVATVSTVGFVVGAVGVATGVVLLVVGAKPKSAPVSASASGLSVRF